MQPASLIPKVEPTVEPGPLPVPRRSLTESDAIEVWIARWLRIRRIDLCRRYKCDPRRLYEIWEGTKHPAARQKAWALFEERYPRLIDRIDAGHHRRIPRAEDRTDQLALFDSPVMQQTHHQSGGNKTRT